MKKTLVSLAAVAALTTGAMAADKGIDFTVTGQAVIYYETMSVDTNNRAGTDTADNGSMFDKDGSIANVGLQLNIGADLGNNFTFGSQLSYLTTAGLENNLVSGVRQDAAQSLNNGTTDELMLTKIFVAKKIGNTTVKLGRQELPKSLSPLAFTEGWSVFKNTFDAILVVNSDIQDTTVVAAYVSDSNNAHGNTNTMTDLTTATKGAYMLTVQNKSIPMTTVTATYYQLSGVTAVSDGATGDSVEAVWIDAKIKGKDMPLGLNIGLQAGQIDPENSDYTVAATATAAAYVQKTKETTAFGAKIGLKPVDALSVSIAYSDVNDGTLGVMNYGTGKKTPLFTQMVYNQDALMNDASAIVAKVAYNMGDNGKIIVGYGMMDDNSAAKQDSKELDVIYKIKAGGVQYFAAYVNRYMSKKGNLGSTGVDERSADIVRVWARYAF